MEFLRNYRRERRDRGDSAFSAYSAVNCHNLLSMYYNGLKENVDRLNEVITKLKDAPTEEIEILSNLMLFFSQSLPEQYEIAYYISKDLEYGLLFDDALIFSFAKLVGTSLESDSSVLFLTKDRDFEVEKVMKELNEVNIEVYFNSGECVQRIKDLLA